MTGKALEHPVVDHRLRAGVAFLGRLEAEDQRPVEGARLGEMPRRAEQHGRVAVVAAGVHPSGRARRRSPAPVASGIGSASMSARKQHALVGVRRRAARAVQQAEDAGLADALDHLVEAESAQPLGDEARGARQLRSSAPGGGGGRAAIR